VHVLSDQRIVITVFIGFDPNIVIYNKWKLLPVCDGKDACLKETQGYMVVEMRAKLQSELLLVPTDSIET